MIRYLLFIVLGLCSVNQRVCAEIVFRYSGEPGYDVCYRIPALTTVENGRHKGRIVAINDYRYCGGDIGAGRIDLHLSMSDDNGKTWTRPSLLQDSKGNPVAKGNETSDANCAFGDAAIVSDRMSGDILMLAVGGHKNFFASRRNAPNSCFRWYSDDGGTTWTKEEDITEQILSLFDGEPMYGKIDGQFFGSGRICQSQKIKRGDYYRIYAVLTSQNDGGNTRNWCLFSDDFGKNWSILGGVPAVSVNGDEPKAEELPDGSVIVAARNRYGDRNFNIFHYDDLENDNGRWGEVCTTDMGQGRINACDGEIMILPVKDKVTGKRCDLVLQSFPYGGSRKNVSIAWKVLECEDDYASPDRFEKWNGRYQVSDRESAYSTMTWQKNNTLGFLYEENLFGRDYCGVYRNITLEEITGNAYEYCPE